MHDSPLRLVRTDPAVTVGLAPKEGTLFEVVLLEAMDRGEVQIRVRSMRDS
jgi:hypothetical protein